MNDASPKGDPREGRRWGPLGTSLLFSGEPRAPCGGRRPPKTSGTFLSQSRARSSRGFETLVIFKSQEMLPAPPVRGELPGVTMASSGWSHPSAAPGPRRPALGRHKPAGTRHPSLRGAGRCPQAGARLWKCGTPAVAAAGDPSRAPCTCRSFTFTGVKLQRCFCVAGISEMSKMKIQDLWR